MRSHIYEGDDRTCSLCQEEFEHGQQVCRLTCRHMFHASCWESYTSHSSRSSRQEHMSCPNCRGPGRMIAVWPYIDSTLTTQVDPHGSGEQVPNTLGDDSYTTLDEPVSTGSRVADDAADDLAPSTFFTEGSPGYHIRTQLADGRLSLIIDPGSVGNLCGDKWAKSVAQAAARNGKNPSYEERAKPLNVSGVGHGSQSAPFDCSLPISLKQVDGLTVTSGKVTTPAVSNSDLPGLLGLTALRKNKAIIDFSTMKMYFTGPGNYDLDRALPPGTDCFQCELAPSGHMVLPCCEYDDKPAQHSDGELTLVTRQRSEQPQAARPPGLCRHQ